MKTLNKYIEELLDIANAGHGDLPVIYSSDDEGNNYHKVNDDKPSLFVVKDITKHNLEFAIEYDKVNLPLNFEPNCVIIN